MRCRDLSPGRALRQTSPDLRSASNPGREEIRSCLPNYSSGRLAAILRQILQQIEEATDGDLNDLAFIQLKVIMLEKIAQLEEEHLADPHSVDLN